MRKLLVVLVFLVVGGLIFMILKRPFKKQEVSQTHHFEHPAVEHPEVAGKRVINRIELIEPKKAPNFTLTDFDRSKISLEDFKGKLVLIGFIYTHCPDVCGILTMHFRQIQRKFSDIIGKDLELIFITTDPERDTPERLKAYTEGFKGKWHFLTGTREEMEKVWEAYHVFVKDKPAAGIVYHTYMVVLIDWDGFIRYRYIGLVDPQDVIVKDIEHLLSLKKDAKLVSHK
jgi:protein SCO1/2